MSPVLGLRAAALLAIASASAIVAQIPQGTHVLLRMTNSISTKTARPGDFVYMQTASPIALDGRIIVPVNSYVQGAVTAAKRSGRAKGRAELAIRLDSLTLPSGKVVKFTPHLNSVDANDSDQKAVREENTIEQGGDLGHDAAVIAVIAGSGASLGGLTDRSWKGAGIGAGTGTAVGLATVLLTRGREVELTRGTTLDVVFDRPLNID